MRSKKSKAVSSIFTFFIIAVTVAILLRVFVFSPILIDGTSMEPTMFHKDSVILQKVLNKYELGDIIVFDHPNSKYPPIKRIIALEGDVIKIEDGIVYRNNIKIDEPYKQGNSIYDVEEIVIPAGKAFVLGDHRNVSLDSSSYGCIELYWILGEAKLIYNLKDWRFDLI